MSTHNPADAQPQGTCGCTCRCCVAGDHAGCRDGRCPSLGFTGNWSDLEGTVLTFAGTAEQLRAFVNVFQRALDGEIDPVVEVHDFGRVNRVMVRLVSEPPDGAR